ncbi:unnamed protein product, partial [Effrenium voratum]
MEPMELTESANDDDDEEEDLLDMGEETTEMVTEDNELSVTGHGQTVEMNEAMFERYQMVQDQSFEEIQMPVAMAEQIQQIWSALVAKLNGREAAGEAIYDAILEEAPSMKSLFKSPRSVFAMRFMNGLNSMIAEAANASSLKKQVETYGFMHLELDLSTPRVEIVRDAILSVLDQELGLPLTSTARASINLLLNYIGGAFIFIRRELAGRIRIINRSWRAANRVSIADMPKDLPGEKEAEEEKEKKEPGQELAEKKDETHDQSTANSSGSFTGRSGRAEKMQVPTTFSGMFLFNAAVMGFGESQWMNLVLDRLDSIAMNAANTGRLQEECYVLSIHLSKVKEAINLYEFKAVMLAALRSLVPDDWNMDHEVAWNWLWENVERILQSTISLPRTYERVVRNFLLNLSEEHINQLRQLTFKIFFERAPAGQDYFKQSATRLFFILDKNNEMVMEMYSDPSKVVEELSALGLRHVGYGVPIE